MGRHRAEDQPDPIGSSEVSRILDTDDLDLSLLMKLGPIFHALGRLFSSLEQIDPYVQQQGLCIALRNARDASGLIEVEAEPLLALVEAAISAEILRDRYCPPEG